mmetsp:Transcript_5089/g.16278  ORF Transcript_5089/g.16278 Transcript_5089/m.16278 type:complete len:258 (+) Transcript_5089:1722-2495(+)
MRLSCARSSASWFSATTFAFSAAEAFAFDDAAAAAPLATAASISLVIAFDSSHKSLYFKTSVSISLSFDCISSLDRPKSRFSSIALIAFAFNACNCDSALVARSSMSRFDSVNCFDSDFNCTISFLVEFKASRVVFNSFVKSFNCFLNLVACDSLFTFSSRAIVSSCVNPSESSAATEFLLTKSSNSFDALSNLRCNSSFSFFIVSIAFSEEPSVVKGGGTTPAFPFFPFFPFAVVIFCFVVFAVANSRVKRSTSLS